jgi:predicted N-formylglutamate amidohydrolase
MGQRPAKSTPPLLGPDDPPPYRWVNRKGQAPLVLACDHGSWAVPGRLGTLGLAEETLRQHIGWDIGAAWVTERLAQLLDAPALIAGYSRLVIDGNRYTTDPASIAAHSDGTDVPGNQDLEEAAAKARADEIFHPYHDALAEALEDYLARDVVPALLSVHSMTPEMDGVSRPWHIGICWARDQRLAAPVMDILRRSGQITVGDNEPYAVDLGEDYTVPEQALRRGLPHLQVEFRQDLIDGEGSARRWAEVLAAALVTPLTDPSIHRLEHHWP